VDAEPDRTARRLNWTEVEDFRLVRTFITYAMLFRPCFSFLSIAVLELQISTWLNIFKLKNVKNNVAHWPSVVKVYNSSTPKDRRRASKQLKPHWQNINNKKIAHFYDYWCEWRQNIPIMSTVPKCS
jgi:hypothetical protein